MEILQVMRFYLKLYETLDSTQEMAEALAREDADGGTVIQARAQTRGRGRGGRGWYSPRGGLWMSLILRPDPRSLPFIGLMASLALVRVLRNMGLTEAVMKWPNDVYVSMRKVAGILVDASFEGERVQYAILGIGLNVNNELQGLGDERRNAVSMRDTMEREFDLNSVRDSILEEISILYGKLGRDLKDFVSELLGERILIQATQLAMEEKEMVSGRIVRIGEAATMTVEINGMNFTLGPS